MITTEIRVLNKRSLSSPLPGVAREYVGRPSPLGNPFPLRQETDRDLVVQQYRDWLRKQWQANGPAKAELLKLCKLAKAGDLELVCWCAPKACHADVIREAILAISATEP